MMFFFLLIKNGWRFAPYIDGLNKKSDIIVLSEMWFNETNIDNLPGYKAFNSVRTKKTGGGLSTFCRNSLSFKALEVSNSNTEVIEYVHVKLHSPNKKTINIVGIYRAPSHGVRARFLSEVEKITNSFSSRELNVQCVHINIDLLKLDNVGKSYVDMMISLSLEQHIALSTRIRKKESKIVYWHHNMNTYTNKCILT